MADAEAARLSSDQGPGTPGPAVDTHGNPVIDPTANVLALVAAQAKRQDDIATLRAYYTERESDMRAQFQKELAEKEAARIDANRAQDQDSARRATETALTAVQALAVQAPITADAVRVAAAASLNPVLERLTNIERVQYEQAGQKQQITERRENVGAIYAAIGLGVTLMFLLLGIITFAIANSGGAG